MLPLSEYATRRLTLARQLPPRSAFLLPAAPLGDRNRDAEYAFRQDSDFYYLSGFDEPDALLLLLTDGAGDCQSILFVQPLDPAQEVWTGYRAGSEGAVQQFGFDRAFILTEQNQQLPQLLGDCERVYYPFSDSSGLADRVGGWCRQQQAQQRSSDAVPQLRCNVEPVLHQLRLIKSDNEQQLMRRAGQISAQAHRLAMHNCRPGLFEFQLEADIQHLFGHQGCRFAAYGTIVGSGMFIGFDSEIEAGSQ